MAKLIPTDDHIFIEALDAEDGMVNGIYRPTTLDGTKREARVIACGPGELRHDGSRNPMPCSVGDVILVNAGAGFRFKYAGADYWCVYGGRKDIIAVVEESPALVAA